MSVQVSKYTIAVVDDDSSVVRALSRLLRTAGYDVHSFSSGTEFLDEAESAPADCLILDVQMPGMTGFELSEKLSQAGRHLPVVFISAHDSAHARQQAASLNASGFLIKPFSPKSLLARIASVVEGAARS